MAVEEALRPMNGVASADLSTKQYYGVTMDSNGRIAVVSGQEGAAAIGILQDKPAALGRACNYAIGGRSKVVLGGTLVAGDRFTFDTNGKAVAVGSGDDYEMGYITEGGTNGVIGSCVIQPLGQSVRG